VFKPLLDLVDDVAVDVVVDVVMGFVIVGEALFARW